MTKPPIIVEPEVIRLEKRLSLPDIQKGTPRQIDFARIIRHRLVNAWLSIPTARIHARALAAGLSLADMREANSAMRAEQSALAWIDWRDLHFEDQLLDLLCCISAGLSERIRQREAQRQGMTEARDTRKWEATVTLPTLIGESKTQVNFARRCRYRVCSNDPSIDRSAVSAPHWIGLAARPTAVVAAPKPEPETVIESPPTEAPPTKRPWRKLTLEQATFIWANQARISTAGLLRMFPFVKYHAISNLLDGKTWRKLRSLPILPPARFPLKLGDVPVKPVPGAPQLAVAADGRAWRFEKTGDQQHYYYCGERKLLKLTRGHYQFTNHATGRVAWVTPSALVESAFGKPQEQPPAPRWLRKFYAPFHNRSARVAA